MKMKKSNLIWGFIFILAGILYILNEFFGLPFDIWDLWPLLIILPSINSMLKNGPRVGNIIFFFLGLAILMDSMNIVDDDILDKLFIPVCLIVIGIAFIFRDRIFNRNAPKSVSGDFFKQGDGDSYTAIFSANKVNLPHDVFVGAEITAIFGGVNMNMREAVITNDAVINCTAIFGGADIFVPAGVNIKVSGLPIFGGVTNKCMNYQNENAPTLYINATCMFGGVTVK